MDYIQMGKEYVMNTYNRYPVVLVKGKGAVVYDEQGNEYLDFVAGIAVNNLGHCHPSVVAAIKGQVENMIHCSNLYWHIPQVELAKLLVENSFGDKVFFCNSGAEANEAAIKLARKYSKKKYGEHKYGIITMQHSFHGRTLGSLTATGQTKYHEGFEPLVEGFKYVPFNDIDALKDAIDENTCAVMMEPIQGEGGIYEADEGYLRKVRELCDEKGLLLIFDEVQCGMGRTGELFAYQHYGVQPDIMTLAKAIAGGLPLGAMIATDEVASAFKPGDHASTFGGNPVACAAGVAVIKELLGGVIDNAREIGEYLKSRLLELNKTHPVINEVRGRGLMLGVEFNMQEVAEVVNRAMKKGLLVLSAGHKVVRMVPPLIITKAEVDKAVEILDQVLKEMEV
ncbi:acetylornithine transaminase [Caldanaerobius polysaccharolyticus]|uniref:acetylornithine transaminase n=1 Tax=Caldanaerobius polysaccharolyticus TaxID=44256 RepID=UPI00047D0956|nr:acetylornithine transaminase [Caldanaerobius polysaccharolyticus]